MTTAARTLLAILLVSAASTGLARVERIEITERSVVAEGRAFGLAGPYEKLVGRVHFAFDPEHPANCRVVDLDQAPRDDDGRVRTAADLFILRPVDASKGNGTLFLEVSNRGGKASVFYFNRGAERSSDPTEPAHFGDGFLMRHGFTLVWVGWQWDVPPRPELLRIDPVWATEGEEPIEGLVRADHVFAEDAEVFELGHRGHRAYPVVDPSDERNVLTVRDARLDDRTVIPRERWQFARVADGKVVADPTSIRLEGGFERGKIYEAVYVARDPAVVGIGPAGIRDLVSYLRHTADSPAPAKRAIGFGISQTGRFLRLFLYQGFNADLEGRAVFDGVWAHTAGAGRGSFNHRFGQPSRDAHPFSAFFYPTDIFPFTGEAQHDPETDRADGLAAGRQATGVWPKVFFTNSGYEYWGRAASLIHTSIDGKADVAPLETERIYHFASAQHFVDRFPPVPGSTKYPANAVDFKWALRALLLDMNAWIADGVEPPPSRYPRVENGTLVPATKLAFPAIPGVDVPTSPHEAYRADYGPRFQSDGIVDLQPPAIGKPFPVLVSAVDDDGNEIAGIRLPEVEVPLATMTPWNWRAEEIGAPGELADFRGSFLPFAATRTAGEASGDPRLSVEERYGSRDEYLGRYAEVAVRLVRQRYVLAEDLPEMIEHAGRLWELVVGESVSEENGPEDS